MSSLTRRERLSFSLLGYYRPNSVSSVDLKYFLLNSTPGSVFHISSFETSGKAIFFWLVRFYFFIFGFAHGTRFNLKPFGARNCANFRIFEKHYPKLGGGWRKKGGEGVTEKGETILFINGRIGSERNWPWGPKKQPGQAGTKQPGQARTKQPWQAGGVF